MLYQLAYIIPLKYTEKEIPQIIKKINELIKNTGVSDIKEESWNKRKIAYPIKQNRHGYFVAAQISAESKNLAKINQELNNLPEILRHSIVKFKPGSFNPTKKSRPDEPSDGEGKKVQKDAIDTKKISSQINSLRQKTIFTSTNPKLAKREGGLESKEKTVEIKKDIKLSPQDDSSKKTDKPKIALEDLDKKLEEILSSDNLKT